jgi:glucose/arabinose dehydrogenase
MLLRRLLCSGLILGAGWGALATARADFPRVEFHPVCPKLEVTRPLWMEEAPDGSGRFFIVEQQGRILVLPKGSDGTSPKEFLNIVDRKPFIENEEGLLGFACHPQFGRNGRVFAYYTQQNPKRSVISEFKVSADDPDRVDLKTERVLFEIPQPYWNHNGGQVSWYLYRGQKYPALRGLYIYADYTLGTIWGLRHENNRVAEYGTLLEQPKNIASFAQDRDGELYVLAFDGKVFQLGAAPAK